MEAATALNTDFAWEMMMYEWHVYVEGIGDIGTVHERNETLALRCAQPVRRGRAARQRRGAHIEAHLRGRRVQRREVVTRQPNDT
jgi:hypothetical protein